VCARPSRHFGPAQTPSAVARASTAVDSSRLSGYASEVREGEQERDGTLEGRSARGRAREAGAVFAPRLRVAKARDRPLVLPPSRSRQRSFGPLRMGRDPDEQITLFISRTAPPQRVPVRSWGGWGCMIHDVGDTGPYFDPGFHPSRPSLSLSLCPPVSLCLACAPSFLASTSRGLELFAATRPSSFPPLPCLGWREWRFQRWHYPTAGLAGPFSLTNFPPRIAGESRKRERAVRPHGLPARHDFIFQIFTVPRQTFASAKRDVFRIIAISIKMKSRVGTQQRSVCRSDHSERRVIVYHQYPCV